jgi:hypothetical protein
MEYRISLCAAALMACLSLSSGTAVAQAPGPSISGPANGTDVVPSAAVQKQVEGRSAFSIINGQPSASMDSALAAGAPGVEGAPGGPSGRDARR